MAGTRTFQDHNFLVWEVYPSGTRAGRTGRHLIFNCLTRPALRPRVLHGAALGDVQPRNLSELTPAQLVDMLERARDLP